MIDRSAGMVDTNQITSPTFNKPPVVETVLGVQFDPLTKFTNAHLGAFWRSLGPGWPHPNDAPSLKHESERFGDQQQWVSMDMLQLQISNKPALRVQIRNDSEDRMIQLQNGRLHYNWLGHKRGQQYVRYDTLREEFLVVVQRFREFLAEYQLGEFRPNQWEVTYVNQLPQGTVWNTPEDWQKVFSSSVVLPMQLHKSGLESFSGQWHYEIKPERGRLHVELSHGRDLGASPPTDLLVFKLTARGPASTDQGGHSFVDGLDLGHDVIVNSFRLIASDDARRSWEEQ